MKIIKAEFSILVTYECEGIVKKEHIEMSSPEGNFYYLLAGVRTNGSDLISCVDLGDSQHDLVNITKENREQNWKQLNLVKNED